MKHLGVFETKEEAIQKLGPNIEWYDTTHPDKRYVYSNNCFHCGSRPVGYLITEYADGGLVGKPLCVSHYREFSNWTKK